MNAVIEKIHHVTAEWLNSVLQSSGCLERGKVIHVRTEPSLKVGATSDRFHLEIDYEGDRPRTAPARLFLKISHPQFFGISKKEIDFYRASEGTGVRLPILQCYNAAWANTAEVSHLLLQDLSETHAEIDTSRGPIRSECERAVECLAKIHAFWWDHPRLGEDIGARITTDSVNLFTMYLENCLDRLSEFIGDRLSERRHTLYRYVLSSYPTLFRKRMDTGVPDTLVHGDAHLANFMLPNNPDEDSTILIDWQSWRVDRGSDDLAHMMALNWGPDQRQSMEKDLLVHYHNRLLEEGVTGYTWDKCWYGYRASTIRVLFTPLLHFDSKLPLSVWWPLLENSFHAFEDLECRELLDG